MKINDYINSRDIREYWEKIGYQPSALEAAWLVWQGKNQTIKEKHAMWREIIDNTEDCPIPAGLHGLPQPSLHSFLKRYTEIELQLISAFFEDEPNAVYSYRMYFDDDADRDWYNGLAIFRTFDEAYIHSKGDEETPSPNFIEFIKTYIGEEEKKIFVRFNLGKEIVRLDEAYYITEEEDEIFHEVFENMWFAFPTPFGKGDIVETVHGKYTRPSCFGGKFVLTSLCTENLKGGDGSDMTAHGYFVGSAGEVYHECIHNYMDLEYVRDELRNGDRLLVPISAYLKGEIDLGLLLGAQRIMLCENEANDVKKLLNYTGEGMRIAGIEK